MLVHDKIKIIRNKQGITRNKLAELVNYSVSFISKLENGVRPISPEMLELLKDTLGYVGVPITDDEVDSFMKELYEFYNSIKNSQLMEAREKSNHMRKIVEKCFEDEFRILYYLFDSYLLMREREYEKARNQLETLVDKLPTFTDEQKYFYYYFYASSIYKDYKKSIQYFLKAEEIAIQMNKREASLYYSLSNIHARIDYTPKSIVYGERALELAQNSLDKAYLIEIEATLAFEYSKIGFHQLALDSLHGCLIREKTAGNMIKLQIIQHNIGCVYFQMEDYPNARNSFDTALEFCSEGDEYYLKNKLYIVYILIAENKINDAIVLIEKFLPAVYNMPDMLLFFESAKHALNLHNKDSLDYIENISIPQLLKMGKHLKAIEYMKKLSDFYEKINSKQSDKKQIKYLKLALLYTNKILKGEL